ncbi:MAG: hypothetical protein ABR958_06795 [Dehalococcoidales bacterium]
MAKTEAIQPGYCIAVHLMPDTAPENCYIGIVDVVDQHGILMNLVHWDDKLDMMGGYTESLFVPWGNIKSMLISTERQPTRRFMADKALKWKQKIDNMYANEKSPTKKK